MAIKQSALQQVKFDKYYTFLFLLGILMTPKNLKSHNKQNNKLELKVSLQLSLFF